jgi:hypothetical protein
MSIDRDPGSLVLISLQAREASNQRDYERAEFLANEAADLALDVGDGDTWWEMTFFRAECLRRAGAMSRSADIALTLKDHPITRKSPALGARVSTSLALAFQGCGKLEQAVVEAKLATVKAAEPPTHSTSRIEAEHALIAALAESDQLDGAWEACLVLAGLLEGTDVSPQTAGLGYWAIGNVAFLMHHVEDGTRYHRLAAENLSPTNDLDLWARFNHGSAAKRLAAGVVEPETLECIDRAEMASSIVGGSERDRLELALTRAHWLVLTGQYDAAIDRLKAVTSQESLLATHTAAEARLLLGQAFKARHVELEALLNLEASEQLFVQSGANDRAAVARHMITEVQRR